MLRFIFVILINLFRAPYTIPRMDYAAKHKDIYSEEKRYRMAQNCIKIIKRSGLIITKKFGVENLPKDGGYIMFANHQGKYDALGIIITHDKPCSVVMDEAKSHVILTRQFIDILDGKRLAIDNVRQALGVIKEVAEEVKQGRKFILFPEGGYFHNKNTVKEFKPGCFKSAMLAKCPIVPVALIDSYKVFEGIHLGFVTTQVHYLAPIFYEEYKNMNSTQIAALVKSKIVEKIKACTGCD